MSFGGSASAKTTGTREQESGTKSKEGSRTEQLILDEDAVNQIITDVLSQAGGLKDIFAGEQTAGIFNSSVAAQSAGNLAAKLTGEIARLTGRKEILTLEDEQFQRKKKTRTNEFFTEVEGSFGVS